jgi:pyochelin synthetase
MRMSVDPATRPTIAVEDVLACLGDVLEREPAELDPDTTLLALGLESFTAVRLRRRLREDTGLDLPLTAFLGAATARSVAAGTVPDAAADGSDTSFPLTPIQAAYLVGRDPAFPLGGVATFYYHEFDRWPAGDPGADLARLAAAWNRLVDRHPMLRMVVGPDARQRILPAVDPYEIAVLDLRDAAPADVDRELAALRARCSHQVRPVDRWPLFDLRAALLPDGRTRLHVGIDVLALDLMSWVLLMREWAAFTADPALELPDPPVTFAELVHRRLTDPAQQRRRERDAAYWAARAADLPPGPALPWTAAPAALGVPHVTRHAAELTAPEWDRLRERAASAGLSPTGLLLAAFALVLRRWGATAGFCLNTTLFDRADVADGDDTPGLDTVVGDFTSTVLVEVPGGEPAGFAGFATGVNHRFWSDLDHRSVSGVEALPRVFDPGTGLPAPAHPVVFTSGVGLGGTGGGPDDDPAGPAAWLGEEVFGVSQTPQVLLDHIVTDMDGRLRIFWDACDGALPPGFVEGMRDAHARLLRCLASEEELWHDPALGADPTFLPAQPVGPGAFDGAGPLLDDPLRAAAARAPDAPALLDARAAVDAATLIGRADRTGAALSGLGLGPGDLVAVVADKGVAQVTALLGVLASGAGYVPVEPSWPASRVASLAAQAGVTHALLAPGADAGAWPDGVRVHELDADGVLDGVDGGAGAGGEPGGDGRDIHQHGGEDGVRARPAPGDLAYAIFTSGSTGRPKGVAIEHGAARTTLDDLALRFPLGPQDRVLALSAFSFDLSVWDIFSVLGSGGAVVLPDPDRQRDPGHWLELMARHRVTLWNTAPALLEMLVEYAELEPEAVRRALAPLRLVFLSADWIPVTLPDRIRTLAPQAQVVSLGGATEASIWSICFPIGEVDPAWPSIPYGRALRGQSFHVLDERGRACPVGATGELFIGGDGLARSYVGDPDQTAERFAVHPVHGRLYRTGDLGRWRPDGTIEFLGRLDRQVKIRGHRIELGEIESTLDRLPGVRHAVARSVPGPDDRPRLVCHVVAADPADPPTDDALLDALRASLPPYMVPNRFLHEDALPVTANGKIDYKALRNPYRRPGQATDSRATDARPTDAPSTGQGPGGRPTVPEPGPGADRPGTAASGRDPAAGGAAPGVEPAVLDVGAALDRGLELRLVVSPGALPPVDALGAAADWARAVRDGLAARGRIAAERVPPDGLLELVLGGASTPAFTPGSAPGDPAGRGSPAATPPGPDPHHPGSTGPVPTAGQPTRSTTPGSGLAGPAPAAGQPAPVPAPPGPPPAAGPDPHVERAVARVLSGLLGGAPVDVTTPFFQLGASSLTLVLAHRALHAELDPQLLVVDLFAHPTVRALATWITGHRSPPAATADPAGTPDPAATPYPAATPDPATPYPAATPASPDPVGGTPAGAGTARPGAGARRALARAHAADVAR